MTWNVRKVKGRDHKKESDHGGSAHIPVYRNRSLVTIRVGHNGLFRKPKSGEVVEYKRGAASYVDFVDKDLLCLLQIDTMLKAVGVSGKYRLYYTVSVCSDSQTLFPLENDDDVMSMVGLMGKDKCVGIYVDHEMKNKDEILVPIDEEAKEGEDDCVNGEVSKKTGGELDENDKEVELSEKEEVHVNIEEPDLELSEKEEVHVDIEESEKEEINVNNGEGCSDAKETVNNNGGEGCSYAQETFDSDGVVSCGEDSEHSDFYIDSDGNYELDDDEDFEKNIDPHLEWVGLQSLKKPEFQLGEPKLPDPVKKKGGRRSKKKTVARYVPKYKGRKVFDPKVDMDEVFFDHNMCFTSTEVLKQAVKRHAVQNCRDIKICMSGVSKLQAKCKTDDCPWYIYASRSKSDNTIVIKTLGDDHDCPKSNKVSLANSTWLSEQFGNTVRNHPNWKVDDMAQELKEKYELHYSKWQMYRLKHLALGTSTGEQEYGLVNSYGEELLFTNPGSTVKIKPLVSGGKTCFQRIYICFAALKAGMLQGCRRVILLDGCHLKTIYGGILLTAVGLDGNNGMYPFAYAVVEKETTQSWTWFLEFVCNDLDITKDNSYEWTVMSDKQKGLLDAVHETMPNAEHRYCVYHLYQNFKLLFKGLTLKELVWRAAKSCRPVDFEKIMSQIETVDPAAYQWLRDRPPIHWSKAYFSCLNQTDILLNNLSECFNSLLRDARRLPIIQLLEYIRIMCMNRIANRLSMIMQHKGGICPRIEQLLDVNRSFAMKYSSTWNGKYGLQVTSSRPEDTWAVNFDERTCSCRRWKLTGIPCGHAISGLMELKKIIPDFVHECYHKSTYIKVYSNIMHPIRGRDEWPIPQQPVNHLYPPVTTKMPG